MSVGIGACLLITENPAMTETTTPPAADATGSRVVRAILGLLLVVPAAAACLLTFFLPSLQLVLMSFNNVSPVGGGSQPVGMANYAHLGDLVGAGGAPTMLLLITGARLAAVLIVPPLLALGVSRALPALQIGARLLLTVPLALFAPFLTMLIWFLVARPAASPDTFRAFLVQGDGMIALTLGCAVMLPVYLAALRRTDDQPPGAKFPWRPLAAVWVVSLLAVIALSIQAFGLSYYTQGGPARSTETLLLLLYRQAFQFYRFGIAAALGTLLLAVIMLIGLIASGVIVWSKLSLQTASPSDGGPETGSRTRPIVIGVVMLLLGAGCCALAAMPFATQALQAAALAGGGPTDALSRVDTGLALINTIVPQLLGIFLVQLPLTYLAALGIGGVRPFGRLSELLLLPFSPWLFATVGPLLGVFFLAARDTKTLDTFYALMPRFALSIPILFILTLFFKGQEAKRQAAIAEGDTTSRTVIKTLILPSLPLALLLGLAAVLVGMQSLAWPLVATHSADMATIPVLMVITLSRFSAANADIGGLISRVELPIFVAFGLIFAVFQIFYLPRLWLSHSGSPAAGAAPESVEPSPPDKSNETGPASEGQ